MHNTVHSSSKKMDWETPKALFDKLNDEFQFTLDLCATKENAKCSKFFTPEDDGLTKDWRGTCWMNPPYGKEIGKWIERAYHQSQQWGSVIVCLVPSRTDTRYWHDYVMKSKEIRFIKSRVKFVGATENAPFPSAIVVFDHDNLENGHPFVRSF